MSHPEAAIPPQDGAANSETSSLPQIRRQVERICEAAGIEYEDLVEMRIQSGLIYAFERMRDIDGQYVRDEFGEVVQKMRPILVDTVTFLGDERDI